MSSILLLSDELWERHTAELMHASGEFNIVIVGRVVGKSRAAELLRTSDVFNIALLSHMPDGKVIRGCTASASSE